MCQSGAIGTARGLLDSAVAGAFSGLATVLNALATAVNFTDFIEADFPGVVVRSGNRPDGRLIDQLSVRFVTQFRYPGSAFFTIGLQHR